MTAFEGRIRLASAARPNAAEREPCHLRAGRWRPSDWELVARRCKSHGQRARAQAVSAVSVALLNVRVEV